ncbi:hypothetical protein [Bradyrhizobium sp. LVM 105]|uniref:hypothetical protein n=1 Tax=Bradyrhizobium sp. LVM 105 TaxID=2341115 RepID=UPI0013DF8474|nr:hypothetical protein [Bradyrhizobium sp. LVM 105]
MSDQDNDCEECFGTGDDLWMKSRYPIRKILYRLCPACGGSGKHPPRNRPVFKVATS